MQIPSFENIIGTKFQQEYQIDLFKNNDIKIKNMIFPNYILQHPINLYDGTHNYDGFEFCRIINKIFGFNYNSTELSYYEIPECKINSNDIVFDCGANTGIFSLYASYKAKKVYAFEPSTSTRHYLKNTQKYKKNNFYIIPYGLYSENKEMEFEQTDNPGASRLSVYEVPDCHKILFHEKIKLITIDSFVKQTNIIPTYIKMDIEGGEINAIFGAKNTILSYCPKMSISIHDSNINKINIIKKLLEEKYFIQEKEEKYYDKLLICIPKGEING